jgi:putative ABC transport system permease protein
MGENVLPLPISTPRAPRGRARSRGPLGAIRRFASNLRDAVLQALVSLFAHKLRAVLTITGVSIGVAAVIGIYTMVAGFDKSLVDQLSALGPSTIYVTPRPWIINGDWWRYRNRPAVGRFDLRAIEQNAKLPIATAPVSFTRATVNAGERDMKEVNIRGTTEKFLDTGGWQIKRGRFLTAIDDELGTDVCIIGADIEDAAFKGRDALDGGKLKIGPSLRCSVVGVFVRKGQAFGQSQDNIIAIPISTFRRAFGQKRGMNIAVIAPVDKVHETEEEVIQVVRTARRIAPDQPENFSVNRQDKMLQQFNQMTLMAKLVMGLIALITLIVGGIGIMNIMLVSVKERTKEIGIRRALGARRTTILFQFLCEAVAVSVVGGLIGTALGIGAAELASILTPMSAAVSPATILLGVGFSAFTGLLFGIWPAWSAASLHPIEALRYE